MENNTFSALNALEDRVRELGGDVSLLQQLPCAKASIQRFNPRYTGLSPTTLANMLPDRIRVGTFEDTSFGKIPMWAYLVDNTTIGSTELVYYSHSHYGNSCSRRTAGEAYGGDLCSEFQHCTSLHMLTATAKFYLYSKGMKTSFAVIISHQLARELIASCKAFEKYTTRNEAPDEGNTIARIQTTQEKERVLTLAVKRTRNDIASFQQDLVTMEHKRMRLYSELAVLQSEMVKVKNDTTCMEQCEKDHLAAVKECKNEQEKLVEHMEPAFRIAYELGRKAERGFD